MSIPCSRKRLHGQERASSFAQCSRRPMTVEIAYFSRVFYVSRATNWWTTYSLGNIMFGHILRINGGYVTINGNVNVTDKDY